MPTNAQKDTWHFSVDSSIYLQLLEFPLTSAMRIGTTVFFWKAFGGYCSLYSLPGTRAPSNSLRGQISSAGRIQ